MSERTKIKLYETLAEERACYLESIAYWERQPPHHEQRRQFIAGLLADVRAKLAAVDAQIASTGAATGDPRP